MPKSKRKASEPAAQISSPRRRRPTSASLSLASPPTPAASAPLSNSASQGLVSLPTQDAVPLLEGQLEAITASITNSVRQSILDSLRQQGIGADISSRPQVLPPSTTSSSPDTGHLDATNRDHGHLETIANQVQCSHNTTSSTQSGGYLGNGSVLIQPPVPLACRPLHSKVNNKIKEKIWAGEYIQLSQIHQEHVEGDFTFQMGRDGLLGITPTVKKTFLTIEKWTDAFNIFASVRRLKFPQEMEGLSTYQNVVRNIANAGGDWYFYDTNFRKLKQGCEDVSWASLEHELYAIALTRRRYDSRGQMSRSSMQPKGKPLSGHSVGACYKFNSGTTCNGCRFKHICSYCGLSSHPKVKCYKAQARSQPHKTNFDDKAKPSQPQKK